MVLMALLFLIFQAELDLKRLRDPLQVHLPVRQIGDKDWSAEDLWTLAELANVFIAHAFLTKALQVEAGWSRRGGGLFFTIKIKNKDLSWGRGNVFSPKIRHGGMSSLVFKRLGRYCHIQAFFVSEWKYIFNSWAFHEKNVGGGGAYFFQLCSVCLLMMHQQPAQLFLKN